jgi:hypothetical protein
VSLHVDHTDARVPSAVDIPEFAVPPADADVPAIVGFLAFAVEPTVLLSAVGATWRGGIGVWAAGNGAALA